MRPDSAVLGLARSRCPADLHSAAWQWLTLRSHPLSGRARGSPRNSNPICRTALTVPPALQTRQSAKKLPSGGRAGHPGRPRCQPRLCHLRNGWWQPVLTGDCPFEGRQGPRIFESWAPLTFSFRWAPAECSPVPQAPTAPTAALAWCPPRPLALWVRAAGCQPCQSC